MSLFLSGNESLVYGLIWPASFDAPISLAEIRQRTGLNDREIKGVVQALADEHELPIGARRGKPNGYYYCRTADDREAAARPLIRQAVRELHRARRLTMKKTIRELLGQGVLG